MWIGKMGKYRMRKHIGLLALCILFALYLGATCGNEWLIYDTDHVGLWQLCRQNECSWMEYTPSYLVAFLDWYSCVRAFMVLCCMFNFVAILVQSCNIYNEVHFHLGVVRFCMIMSAICVIIGVTVYASEKPKLYEDTWGFGWTFWLAVTAGLLNLLISVYLKVFVKDIKRKNIAANAARKPTPRARPRPTNNVPLQTVNTIPPVGAVALPVNGEPLIDSKDDAGSGIGGRPPSILTSARSSNGKRAPASVTFESDSKSSVTKDGSSYYEGESATDTGTGTYYDDDDDDSSSYSGSSYTSSGSGSSRSSQQFV